jgi:CysZ protein
MLMRSFLLSLQSLSDRRVIAVMAKTIGLTVLALLVAGVMFWAGFDWLFNKLTFAPHGAAVLAAGALMLLIGWLLWRVIAVTILWFFSDDIVDAVEARHYPVYAMMGARPGFAQSAKMALGSIGRALGYNLLALPVYILLLFTGIGAAIAFLLVNALLLGRDLQEMVAARHGRDKAAFGKLPRLMLGLAGTAGMLIPVINLIVPVVATAMAVHMAHYKQPN